MKSSSSTHDLQRMSLETVWCSVRWFCSEMWWDSVDKAKRLLWIERWNWSQTGHSGLVRSIADDGLDNMKALCCLIIERKTFIYKPLESFQAQCCWHTNTQLLFSFVSGYSMTESVVINLNTFHWQSRSPGHLGNEFKITTLVTNTKPAGA